MYILSIDIGSTNIKAVALKVTENDKEGNIELIGKVRRKTTDFALFICEIFDEYNINKKEVEVLVVTGSGSSYLGEDFDGIKVIKVDEFNAISYGGLLLSKKEKGIIISIGTGTSIIYSDLVIVKRLAGLGLGGGMFVGLGNLFMNGLDENKIVLTFDELIEIAKKGNPTNVDLTIGDISKSEIANLSKDTTAANFAGMTKHKTKEDLVAATAKMILENVCYLAKSFKQILYINDKKIDEKVPIIFSGTIIKNDFIKELLDNISRNTGDEYIYVEEADFAIAIGAYEYYLFKIREMLVKR